MKPFTIRDIAKPYRLRSYIRGNSPWFLIDLGWMAKGKDCEARGAEHEWYNLDNVSSGCYHCEIIRKGQLWMQQTI